MKNKNLLFAFLLFCTIPPKISALETADSITLRDKTTSFSPCQLIAPASLIAIGAWGVCNGWMKSVNHTVRDGMTDLRGEHYFHADDYIQYVPVVSFLGLGEIGVQSKHSFKERLIVAATSYLAMGVMVNGVKYTVKEKRPDSSARNSFPSGHTATVFMGAELVRTEYGIGYGIGSYTLASGVAFLRLYNGRHWLNDVIAGTGIGILSARIGYWLLPVNKKLFGLNKKNPTRTIAAVPTYDFRYKTVGVALAARF